MSEYGLKLNIKADPKDLKKIGEKINKSATKDTDKSTSPKGTAGKNGFGAMIGKLGLIALAITTLKDILSPILKALQAMMMIVFMPLLAVVLSLLRPFLLMMIKFLRDSPLKAGIDMASEGFEMMLTDPKQALDDFVLGVKKATEEGDLFQKAVGLSAMPLALLIAAVNDVVAFFKSSNTTSTNPSMSVSTSYKYLSYVTPCIV